MKRGLRFLNVCSKLWVTVGLIVTLTASNHDAFAGTVKGREAGTFVTVNFTYDGASDAGLTTYSGNDNIGGPFRGQEIDEYSFTGSTCTAPDSTAGSAFVLVQANKVDTYNQGQLYSAAVGATAGSGCASNTTGSTSAIETFSVTGGAGKFANASGSLTITITAQVLAAPGSPPGSFGLFGARRVTRTGSVTY